MFDLEEKNPLDLVVKNKRLVKHLRENKIDGFEINKILFDWQGLKHKYPLRTEKEQATAKEINYAKRNITPLINNRAITKKEKKFLCIIKDRLISEQELFGKKQNKQQTIILKYGKGDAKTFKQMIGR